MKAEVLVQNLKCGGCAATIKKRLSEIAGVDGVIVDESSSRVTVSYDEPHVLTSIKGKLATLGYPEMDAKNDFLTQAKSFVSCATGRISKT